MSQKTINWIIGIVIVIVLAIIGNFMQKCDKGETAKQEKVAQTQEIDPKYSSWTYGWSDRLSFYIPPGFKIIEKTSDSKYAFTTLSGGTDNNEVFKIEYHKNVIKESISYEDAIEVAIATHQYFLKTKGFEVDFEDAKTVTFGANTYNKWTSNYDYCNVYLRRHGNDVYNILTITANPILVQDFLEALKVQ